MKYDKYSILIFCVLILTSLVYLKTLFVYFVQDDFFLLLISSPHSFSDFMNFFIPRSDTVWYRPLSSQVFFGIGQILFKFNPVPYHALTLLTHMLTVFFIYKSSSIFGEKKPVGLVAALFYGIQSAHTVSLSWLAAFSFILGPLFLLLSLTAYVKNKQFSSILFYFLGLLATEVSVIFVLWLVGFILFFKQFKFDWKLLMVYVVLGISLFWLRLSVFPSGQTIDLYAVSITPAFFSTLKFYLIRLVGFPMLIDEMPILLKTLTYILGSVFTGGIILGVWSKIYKLKNFTTSFKFWFFISLIGLSPFLLLSNHIAPHYLSFSLLGAAYVFSTLILEGAAFIPIRLKTVYLGIIVIAFVIWQFIGIEWTFQTHWIFRRADLAKKLVQEKKFEQPVGSEEYFALGAESAQSLFK